MNRKKFLIALAALFTGFKAFSANVTNVVAGGKITLDGTSQKISFKTTKALTALLQKQGFITVYVYVTAASGVRVANETISSDPPWGLHAVDSIVAQTIVPGQEDLYLKGTNTEVVIVSY